MATMAGLLGAGGEARRYRLGDAGAPVTAAHVDQAALDHGGRRDAAACSPARVCAMPFASELMRDDPAAREHGGVVGRAGRARHRPARRARCEHSRRIPCYGHRGGCAVRAVALDRYPIRRRARPAALADAPHER
jgi:hypothetical protein